MIEFAPLIQTRTTEYFRKAPSWLIETNKVQQISGNALKIYIVLLFYSSIRTHCGKITNRILAEKAGVNRSHIHRHIKELEEQLLILNLSKGWMRHYKILTARPRLIDVPYKQM